MDERAALDALADRLPTAGDDCAVVDGLVLTTDMLHASTDFPAGTTSYTAGWRAVGASLSDVASMGAEATAAVAVYMAPRRSTSRTCSRVRRRRGRRLRARRRRVRRRRPRQHGRTHHRVDRTGPDGRSGVALRR